MAKWLNKDLAKYYLHYAYAPPILKVLPKHYLKASGNPQTFGTAIDDPPEYKEQLEKISKDIKEEKRKQLANLDVARILPFI